jgi:DUF4097 and DUF4098 domain-containing protein YvlB
MTSILMAVLCLWQAGPYTREQVDSIDIEPGTSIEVSNVNGDISILGWERDFVEIKSTMKTEHDSSEFKRVAIKISAGDPLRIETKYEKSGSQHKSINVSVDYVIRVPARAGDLNVELVNGDLDVKGVPGDARVSCVNGDIDLRDIGGVVKAECVSGDILIQGAAVLREASTVSGDIEVKAAALADAGMDLSSVSGSIRLVVDKGLDADLDLATISGDVMVRGLDVKDMDGSRHHVRGVLNRGGVKISISTTSGEIAVLAGE